MRETNEGDENHCKMQMQMKREQNTNQYEFLICLEFMVSICNGERRSGWGDEASSSSWGRVASRISVPAKFQSGVIMICNFGLEADATMRYYFKIRTGRRKGEGGEKP